jgi:S1-C subfamily serine protease
MRIYAGQDDALPPPPVPVDEIAGDSLVRRMLTAIAAAIIAAAIAYVLLHSADGRLFSAADAGSEVKTLASTTAARMPPWGLYLRDLTDAEREERKVKSGILVIVAVGASAIAGVMADDAITKVDDKVVRSVDEFWNFAAATNGRFALSVRRKDEDIVIKIGGAEGEVVAIAPRVARAHIG